MWIGGHRGCGVTDRTGRVGVAQENSAQALAQAFSQGADFVEVDWVWDAQGEGWLCHSMRLSEHIADPPAEFLDQLSSAQVQQLVGLGGQPLMSLSALIQVWSDRRVNVEIKGLKGIGRERCSPLSQRLPAQWPKRWWFSSFDPLDLIEFRARWPAAQLALLSTEVGDYGAMYADGSKSLSGSQAIDFLADFPDIWWHPELTDRPNFDRTQVGWCASPAAEQANSLDGLTGLITDRLDAWRPTE